MFASVTGLNEIIIPDGVLTIGASAFEYCENAEKIVIPEGVVYIGYRAFFGCYKITEVTIPDSVKVIDVWAFRCESINSVILPKDIKFVSKSAFFGGLYGKNDCKVYYKGTAEDWKNVLVDPDDNSLTNAVIYYYSETKPAKDGNFWHFVNGKPVKW